MTIHLVCLKIYNISKISWGGYLADEDDGHPLSRFFKDFYCEGKKMESYRVSMEI
jgi:hypothetical protein